MKFVGLVVKPKEKTVERPVEKVEERPARKPRQPKKAVKRRVRYEQ